jgi:hypothetical protein
MARFPKTSLSANGDRLDACPKHAQGILDRIEYSPVEVKRQERFNTTRKSRVLRISVPWKIGTAINDSEVNSYNRPTRAYVALLIDVRVDRDHNGRLSACARRSSIATSPFKLDSVHPFHCLLYQVFPTRTIPIAPVLDTHFFLCPADGEKQFKFHVSETSCLLTGSFSSLNHATTRSIIQPNRGLMNQWTAESLGAPLSAANFASVSIVSGAMDRSKRTSKFSLLPAATSRTPLATKPSNVCDRDPLEIRCW